ncbi:MAG: hypothetical protein DRZ82_09140 [Thermoprotei archaeon]|nr:MAG: hypothetical protein DRZ82_09140 [Thermoprotei archaeon]
MVVEPFNLDNYRRLIEENIKRLEKAYDFEEADRVPIIIDVGGPYYAKIFGYTLAEYYNNLGVMLEVQIKGIKWRLRWLKDDLAHIGVQLDIGSIAEGIVFNCDIVMPDERNPWQSPWIVPRIKRLEDIDELEVPDPYSHKGIKEYYRRLERFRKLVKDNYGNLPVGGRLQIHPPVSAAGSLMGPRRLYTWIYKYPNEMHKLFRKLEETFIALQEFYYDITGAEPGSLGLPDDHAGYLSRKLYEKFALPYNLRLYELFGKRYRALHMDSHMDHITDILVNVYRLNFADVGVENDIRIISRDLKGKIVFKGNANWRVLLSNSYEKIEMEIEKCIYYAAPGGGYIFDNGGETYTGVPPEKLKYEVEYAKKVGKYPIRKENFKHLDRILKY